VGVAVTGGVEQVGATGTCEVRAGEALDVTRTDLRVFAAGLVTGQLGLAVTGLGVCVTGTVGWGIG
jgi:hypothetical protein